MTDGVRETVMKDEIRDEIRTVSRVNLKLESRF